MNDKQRSRFEDAVNRLMEGVPFSIQRVNALNELSAIFYELSNKLPVAHLVKFDDKKVNNTCRRFMTWTDEDDAFLRENYMKISGAKIAKKLKRSVSSIYQRACILGLSGKTNDTISKNTNDNVAQSE